MILMTGTAQAMDFSVKDKDVLCSYNFVVMNKTYIFHTTKQIKGKALFKNTENNHTTWAVDFTNTINDLGVDSFINPYIINDIDELSCKLLDNNVSK